MSTNLAEYALAAAMLTCVAVIFGAVRYLQTRNDGLLRAVRAGLGLIALFLAAASWGLLDALMNDNFKLEYVVRHSEKSLAPMYKAAAFWAGQEGSLLFWAMVLALMGVLMAWAGRRRNDAEQAVSLGVMALVTGFFTCVMLFAGNPFTAATTHTTTGDGLNPMLQNLAMVIHPPMLFLGYAGFTAPFALLLGALLTGRKDAQWLRAARPWMVYSWIMLTVGIVLGAQWAYVELGWGGYWAWDPVENASILPWFTGTALLHSAILQTNRGIFKRWTASLVAASFFLCVFGTYLTRSGVIQSVHSFGESPIGTFFLAFLTVIGLVSVITLILRRKLLITDHPLEDLFSREGFFLIANVLLCLMTALTLVGTIFPIISGAFGSTPVTVNASFYNKVILPMALLLAALMATGPVLGSGAGAGTRAIRKLAGMVMTGSLAALGIFALGYNSLWPLMAAFVIGAVVAGLAIDLATTFQPKPGQNLLLGIAKAFALRTRHWGAQLAHLGLAAIIAGVAGSSVYGATNHLQLKPADGATPATPARVGNYTFTLKGFDQIRRANHTAMAATVEVKSTDGTSFQLQPERRFYDSSVERGESSSEVAIRFSLGKDVYLTLDGWEDGNKGATIGVIINPLVSWIWIGGALLTLGGLVCLIPVRRPAAAPAEEPAPARHTAKPAQVVAAARRTSRTRKATLATGNSK